MTQPSLLDDATLEQRILDKAEASRQTEAGVAKAKKKLQGIQGGGWRLGAIVALEAVARRQAELTGDDVWAELGEVDPRYGAQMGVVFRFAQGQGLIKSTGRFVESKRPSRHRSGIRVWASLVQRA